MKQRGFTLIELLVVIAIIAILMSVIRPMLSGSASKTREFECESNLRQISMAMQAYVQDYDAFPAKLGILDRTLQDKSLLSCPKTSGRYYYKQPRPDADRDADVASCIRPGKRGPWPHRDGDCYLALTAGGGVHRVLKTAAGRR